ncbi:MAG: hypothetical protein EA397_04240 [Deltaproteobacteria bacterium]|nr:MAG: hypothetical protein EA397_04240 [Deltaproteobacteria bacterium]
MRACLLLLSFFACSTTASDEPAGGAEPAEPADEPASGEAAPTEAPSSPTASDAGPARRPIDPRASVRRAMAEHAEHAQLAKAALVTGELAAFRRAVEGAGKVDLPGERAELSQRYLDALKDAGGASDLAEAGVKLGAVGQACADCHAKTPAGRYPPMGFVERTSDLDERMQLHWWAVEAMWQGLTAPSLRSWEVGAKALSTPELDLVAGFPEGEEASTQAQAFAQVARSASGVAPAERGAALGRVLVQCAACHVAVDGPALDEP